MRELKQVGEQILQQKAAVVTEVGSSKELIEDMINIMRESKGVGIAAPQVGDSERIIVIEVNKNERYPDAPTFPLTVMINPVVTNLSDEMEDGYEACLSVPGIRGIVPRYKKIKVNYIDNYGNTKEDILEGFSARVVQHEVDHLEGIVYLERIRDLKTIITTENYLKYVVNK